jgi:hypothetical protein
MDEMSREALVVLDAAPSAGVGLDFFVCTTFHSSSCVSKEPAIPPAQIELGRRTR